jgi:hypothetical protein
VPNSNSSSLKNQQHYLSSNEDGLDVREVDRVPIEGEKQIKEMYSKSNFLQASINNFAFQTPNPNYYSTLAQFKFQRTGGLASGGLNTPNG